MRFWKCCPVNVIILLLISFFLVLSCPLEKDSARFSGIDDSFRFMEYTIARMQEGYRNGDFTIEEVVKSYLDRIEAIDKNGPQLNSVIQVNPDALMIAKQLDRELQLAKPRSPMHGIPVLLKDNIDTHDKMPTTAGSRALSRAQDIRMRLGGSPSLGELFPDKPKGMHWRTYARLWAEAEDAEGAWWGSCARRFKISM